MTAVGGWLVGFHPVLAALESGRAVDMVWVQQGRSDARVRRVLDLARAGDLPVRRVPRRRLDEVAGDVPHNGLAARTSPIRFQPLEAVLRPENEPGRLLLLDSVTDPHNVGAVIRSAAAFAADGVILSGPGAPPLSGALAKASAGYVESVPLVRTKVAADIMVRAKRAGYWCYGADSGGAPATGVRPIDRWMLCIGSEERGLRAKTRGAVDEMVSVPMAPEVESLNVSVATGILLFILTGGVRRTLHSP